MSVHVSSVSSFDFPSDKIIIADINFFVKLDTAERYASERTPAYRGGSFLLQREQRHGLQRVAAAYNLSTGVDSRATHGIFGLRQVDIRLASSRIFMAAFLSRLW